MAADALFAGVISKIKTRDLVPELQLSENDWPGEGESVTLRHRHRPRRAVVPASVEQDYLS